MSILADKKIGVLGRGKTGQYVAELLGPKACEISIFSRENPVTKESLSELDGVISFFPGEAFLEVIPLLIETPVPVVSGSTGFNWPKDIGANLLDKNLRWIHGHNFSLGMNLVYQMIKVLSKGQEIFPANECNFNIHEVHHTKKLDAPSGTALAWKDWLDLKEDISCPVTSERVGDVVGHHELSFKTPFEEIKLTHTALDRRIFARGAIWGLERLLEEKTLVEPGLNVFQEVAIKYLLKDN